jgi:hypothetical protein
MMAKPPAASSTRMSPSLGAQLEVSTIADVLLSGRIFFGLDAGSPRSGWAPSFRIALGRSGDADARPPVGHATLRFTQAEAEICPWSWALARALVIRPCAAGAGGAVEAKAQGVSRAQDGWRPWIAGSILARVVWAPLAPLSLEADAGAVAPILRDTFVFEPNVLVYQAPPAALLARIGIGLRFP